jgi:pilus assembly protein CpaC
MTAAYTTQLRRLRRATISTPAAGFNTTAALVVFFIIVILVAAPMAQQTQPAFTPAPGSWTAASSPLPEVATDIDLLVGRSTILNVGSTISRVSLTVPDIADAMVTAPSQLLIHGKTPGTISLFVWDRAGSIKTFEVKVRRDLTPLVAQLKQLFPGEPITALGSGKDIVLSGTVSAAYVIEKAGNVAGGYVEKKENVVNLLKQQEGVASNQVMLRVRFAEVSRTAVQELGATYFLNKTNWAGRIAPPGVPAPDFDPDKGLVFADFLNLFAFSGKNGLGAALKALQSKGLFQSLAEPNLVAIDGKEASFLAGGEFPIPIVQSGNGANSVTIMFKEFGVRLAFTPTVLGGDLVRIKVKPEVSSLDFANAVTVDGFRIPALTTRRTETEVELRDGQTFAIAGLLNNTLTNTLSKIPGIGDIPILGRLFQSKAHQKNLTELVVMITPVIIKRGQMGAGEGLPQIVEPYLGAPDKTSPTPAPYVGSPRFPGNQPRSSSRTIAPVQQPVMVNPAPPEPAAGQIVGPARTDALAARPIQAPAPLAAVPEPASAPTRQQLKALEQAREEARKADVLKKEQDRRDADQRAVEAKVAERRKAEQARLGAEQAKKELAARAAADRLAKERAVRDAEAAKKKAEDDAKRAKALTDAAVRLKQAQAEYQAELDKAKSGSAKPK